jgi:hypothetical protein
MLLDKIEKWMHNSLNKEQYTFINKLFIIYYYWYKKIFKEII